MESSSRSQRYAFVCTIFLSAFLLFQVQPMIGKYVLPWFGGSPMVWTVCMLFFQVVLFFGYAYAHLVARLKRPGVQVSLHILLLVAAISCLPITPGDQWKPNNASDPTGRILVLLLVSIGLPYLLLSATGPLLQAWYVRVDQQRSPYRLYALSNLGSLLALLSYPFLFDPNLGADQQTIAWSFLFALFAASCAWCGVHVWRHGASPAIREAPPSGATTGSQRPPWGDMLLWFLLAMVPSVMLLATTNQVCTDLAVVPFLWVLPLTLYLLSFILCFHSLHWCSRLVWPIAWGLIVAITVLIMYRGQGAATSVPIGFQITGYIALLFCCAMLCHGELVRIKPEPAHLTGFYLIMSAGGAAGGLFVGVLAPLLFDNYVELPLAIIGCTVLMLVVYHRDRSSLLGRDRPRWAWLCLVAVVLALTATQVDLFSRSLNGVLEIHRNFFGVLRVRAQPDPDRDGEFICQLIHGRTQHGMQFSAADKRAWPTTYYGENSGIGMILSKPGASRPRHIGVVGLGVGTLTAYAEPGDTFQFYEINPDVVQLARQFFCYLEMCPEEPRIVLGDARLSMENEAPQAFDVLVLDAFSSDSIPVHLLTREAFAVYLRHLRPHGILAVHISNMHLDLHPVVAGHAQDSGMEIAIIHSDEVPDRGVTDAVWALLSRTPLALQIPEVQQAKLPPVKHKLHWTDQRSSLVQVLRK